MEPLVFDIVYYMDDNFLTELSNVSTEDLNKLKSDLQKIKRRKQREIDHLDTKMIGIKEELRKRKQKQLAERTFQNSFTQG